MSRTIPDYADVMPLSEFIKCCKHGFFIDYDGTGYYANPPEMDGEPLVITEIVDGHVKEGYTHVAWFNR